MSGFRRVIRELRLRAEAENPQEDPVNRCPICDRETPRHTLCDSCGKSLDDTCGDTDMITIITWAARRARWHEQRRKRRRR